MEFKLKSADDLIRSGEYRIKIVKRSEPLWTMHTPQVKGLFGWKNIWYNPDVSPTPCCGYLAWCYMSDIERAKEAIEVYHELQNTSVEYYRPK